MALFFAPAYVFLYTEQTKESFQKLKSLVGIKAPIDVQNSAPPFDSVVTSAWMSHDGANLLFENGSPDAVVRIFYLDVMRQLNSSKYEGKSECILSSQSED